jgi:hypothetical protein
VILEQYELTLTYFTLPLAIKNHQIETDIAKKEIRAKTAENCKSE